MFKWTSRLASAAKPITAAQFKSAITPCLPHLSQGAALAVSGGVDSMALAFLLKQNLPLSVSEKLVAFVVDHKLRHDSTVEAGKVKEVLEGQLGMRTYILEATGLAESLSADRSNLETKARYCRQTLFRQACSEHDIQVVVTGHHRDDQAELALLRLSAQHKQRLNMTHRHLVNMSSGSRWQWTFDGGKAIKFEDFENRNSECTGVRGFETGGVKLIRPLLNFDKDQLRVTCSENGIPWFEDVTNKDRSLTTRNTVRGLLRDNVLPQALRKESLLRIARVKHDLWDKIADISELLFNACDLKFDISAATLYARLPDADTLGSIANSYGADPRMHPLVAISLLRRLGDIVSREDIVSSASMIGVWEQINPVTGQPKQFGAGNLSFSPVKSKLLISPVESTGSSPLVKLDQNLLWMIRCSSLTRSDLAKAQRPSYDAKSSSDRKARSLFFEVPPDPETLLASADLKLFDGRFWISVQNSSPHSVTISPLTAHHLDYFRRSFDGKGRSHPSLSLLKRRLYPLKSQKLATGAIPVIEWLPNGIPGERDEGGHVLALPTLGFRFDGGTYPDFPEWTDKVKWTVRYKKVDWGKHDVSKCLLLTDSRINTDGPMEELFWKPYGSLSRE